MDVELGRRFGARWRKIPKEYWDNSNVKEFFVNMGKWKDILRKSYKWVGEHAVKEVGLIERGPGSVWKMLNAKRECKRDEECMAKVDKEFPN